MKKQASRTNQQNWDMQRVARQYWIGLAFAVLCIMAMMASPADAAPSPQRTVPTATPTSVEPTSTPDDNSSNDNNQVLDLFDPTATPEPPDFNFDDVDSQDDSGGGSTGGFDDSSEDDTAEADTSPLFETDTEFEPDIDFGADSEFDAVVDTSFLNMFAEPDTNSGIIDTLFRDTPVQVVARSATGDWVYVCCGEERGNQGWVPASDINVGFDLGDDAIGLPIFGDDDAIVDEAGLSDEALGTDELFEIESDLAELELTMFLDSANVLPGEAIELEFAVTNIGDIDAADISLRNELPNILTFEDADFVDGDLTTTTNADNNDAPVFRIDWPELAAGDTVTATVMIQVRSDADYGVVVDNLAGVGASNAAIETAGVTLGTPPVSPPDFRLFR